MDLSLLDTFDLFYFLTLFSRFPLKVANAVAPTLNVSL